MISVNDYLTETMIDMKRIGLAFIFILLAVSNLYSQKCKYDIDKKDEITGKTTRAIEVWQKNTGISLIQVGDSVMLRIYYATGGVRNEAVKVGDSLIVKLMNEKLIYLTAAQEVLPFAKTTPISQTKNGPYGGASYSEYLILYGVSKTQLKELKASPIKFCRLLFAKLSFDLDFKDNRTERIQIGAACMEDSN